MAKKTATKPAHDATAKAAEKPAKGVNLKKAPAQVEPTITTIKDLELKHGLPGKTLRVIIRGLGFRAPKTNLAPGELGPTAKYVWDSENPKHVKALAAIEAAIAPFKDNADSDDE